MMDGSALTIIPQQGAAASVPALIAAAGEGASVRLVEFFAATIRNPDSRRVY